MESISNLSGDFPIKFGLTGLQVFSFLKYGEKQFIDVGVEVGEISSQKELFLNAYVVRHCY